MLTSPPHALALAERGNGGAPPPSELSDIADRWLREYITQPHEQLGRGGPVCPFVEPALRAGTLLLRQETGLGAADGPALRAVLRGMRETFRTARWPHSNPTLHTLLLLLPDLPRPGWALLDELQARAKVELAQDGLMLGQFHPDCAETAARNPRFAVSRSPIPLLAIRHMAVHDVLFLHKDRELFAEYRLRFGDRYERGVAVDPTFREVYDAAAATFG